MTTSLPRPEPTALADRTVSVAVVLRHPVFRRGITSLLDDDERVDVVGATGDPGEALELCRRVVPEVVMVDGDPSPAGASEELVRDIVGLGLGTRVVVIDGRPHDGIADLLSAGAAGYLLRDSSPATILGAVLAVGSDVHALCPEAVASLLAKTGRGSSSDPVAGLTDRERAVLDLLSIGTTNRDIAARLGISEKTVRNHVSRLYTKLALNDRSQVMLFALHHGLAEGFGPTVVGS